MYNFAHRKANKANHSVISKEIDTIMDAWNSHEFEKDSVGKAWRSQYQGHFKSNKNRETKSYIRVELMHSSSGELNQALRDSLNLVN